MFIRLSDELDENDDYQLDEIEELGFTVWAGTEDGTNHPWVSVTLPREKVQSFSRLKDAT